MLNVCDCDKDVLHIWYKLSLLQDEIEKRSSYLGKFRRTEEAQHLLDLISMTKDEENLFYPFARAAAGDVYEVLDRFAPRHEKAFRWREGQNTITIDKLPSTKWTDSGISCSAATTTIFCNISISFIESIDDRYAVTLKVRIPYTTSYSIKRTGAEMTVNKSIESHVNLVYDEDSDNWTASFSLAAALEGEGNETSAERLIGAGNAEIEEVRLERLEPVVFKKHDWVEYDGKLYVAATDGDSNDIEGKLVESRDFRESIHYLIAVPRDRSLSIIEALDSAVFEALVNRVIYKWLVLSYPQEAGVYLSQYNEAIEQIRLRCSRLVGAAVVKRIPRLL
jgi:hypothetical protein